MKMLPGQPPYAKYGNTRRAEKSYTNTTGIGYKRITGSVRQASAKRTLRKIRKSSMRFLDERIGGVFVADRQAHSLRA
jgi:hypothetical protein